MKIFFLRHAETELNKKGIVQGSGVDADLNETGRNQARAFYEAYSHLEFDLVVTSALKRTHQTAEGFIQRGIPWVSNAQINEISWGEHEGQAPSPEQTARFKTMIEAWQAGDLHVSMPGGESALQLQKRIREFIDWLLQRPEKLILVVTHGRALRCLITELKGIGPGDMEGTPHSNTGLYLVHYRDGSFHFEAENDTSHLAGFEEKTHW
jgi:phosphoserine phosphatase